MNDFDRVLDDCLTDLAAGASTLDECLLRHPEHAARLEPLLQAALHLEQGRAVVQPSAAFKARNRAKLTLYMQANPRRSTRSPFMFWRLAMGLVVIMAVFLVTGTAYAQSALPGDSLYPWKLASERAWRAVSPDPVGTDIMIANRRINEMNQIVDDPARKVQALEGYREVLTRLEAELDAETLKQILPSIEIEREPVENPDQPISTPTDTSSESATQQPEGTVVPLPSLPNPPLPVPTIVPTIQVPPLIQ